MGVVKWVAAAGVLAAAGTALAVVVAGRAWDRASAELAGRLTGSAAAPVALDRATLPEVVGRYLAASAPPTSGLIAWARLEQRGVFRMDEGPDGWRPFSAREMLRGSEPGLLWDATIRMGPGVSVRVRDSYADGEAGMVAKILALVPVVDVARHPDLARGALARYLAEAVWIPSRLGAGPGLAWEGVDDRTADAVLRDGRHRVRLRFSFDAEGDPVEVRGLRPREVDGDFVPTPWVGRFSDHRDVGGFRIPGHGEVAWIVDGVEVPYWRGTITSATYETTPPAAEHRISAGDGRRRTPRPGRLSRRPRRGTTSPA